MKFRDQKNKLAILVLMLSVIVMGANASANTVLSKIMAEYPEVPATTVRLISTLPSVFTTILTLLVGPIIGKKIGYRPVCILALALITLGGIGPMFLHSSIGIILVCRAVFGVGFGLFGCRNGYAMLLSEGEARNTIISTLMMIQNISGVIMQLICGRLGDIQWYYAFLPFILGVVPLSMSFIYLKEPEMDNGSKTDAAADAPVKSKGIAPMTYVYCMLTFMFSICGLTWMTGMSSLLAEKGITASTAVGVALASCNAGAIVGSLMFRYISKKNTKIPITISAVLGAIGAFVAVVASSIPMMVVAGLLAGCGYISSTVACNTFAGLSNERSNVTNATTRVMATQAIATFLTGWFIEFCGNAIHVSSAFTANAFVAAIVIQVVIAVISMFFNFGPRAPKKT